jgi:hypothetical protein
MRDFDALETRASKLKKSEKRKNPAQKIVILAKMGQKRPQNEKTGLEKPMNFKPPIEFATSNTPRWIPAANTTQLADDGPSR